MKKLVTASLAAAMALTTVNAASNAELASKLSALEAELASIKTQMKSQNKKINEVKAHDANDNIKWSADVRTAIDSISYDTAAGNTYEKNDLMSLRLWLNMEYAPNQNNIFKGQLAMNKAFGADFGARGWGMDNFDWLQNDTLTNSNLRVRQAYWLYLGEKAFGADIPWTFSVGRRPSTNGFLANLRDDDPEQSPLGHIINVEFDGLSSKLDLSNVTGVTGMSFKLCAGQGATNAFARFTTQTDYTDSYVDPMMMYDGNLVKDIPMVGFIFEPYNDGQYIVKTTYFKAWNLPDLDASQSYFESVGDMTGGAISVLVDGLGDDGILAETKVFGSLAFSQTDPSANMEMLGSDKSQTGTSYWFGAQIPVLDGDLGLEYNHGSKYWRPFDYAEDTMIGSKLAARGDAFEAYYTYHINDALSAQIRYTYINYDYTGSNGFFGSTTGTPMDIDAAKAMFTGTEMEPMLDYMVEKAQDLRFYVRYRF